MTEKNENFPNALEAVVLVAALFLVEYLVGAALSDMRGWLEMDSNELGGMIMVLANGIVFTVVMQYKGLKYGDLFHASPSSISATMAVLLPAIVLTVPLLTLVGQLLVGLLVWLFPLSDSEAAMFGDMSSGRFGMVVVSCILAPVLEEMLFRGLILRSFLRQYSRWSAIIGSATLFGFAHMNLYQYVVALMLGIFLGWLYERTRSLLPSMALHAAYNTALTAEVLSGAADGQDGAGVNSSFTWALALVLGIAGIVMLRRLLLPAPNR
ncbi:MAG: CPBP family intramembrane glutamic endopeptidase [Massilia sp.]